jgi:hypothetical protein
MTLADRLSAAVGAMEPPPGASLVIPAYGYLGGRLVAVLGGVWGRSTPWGVCVDLPVSPDEAEAALGWWFRYAAERYGPLVTAAKAEKVIGLYCGAAHDAADRIRWSLEGPGPARQEAWRAIEPILN